VRVDARCPIEISSSGCRTLAESEIVQRYKAAGGVCRQNGWGHSWVMFQQWFEQGKPRYSGMPECGAFFLDSPQAKAVGVSFNLESDRAAVIAWRQAVGDSEKALMAWSSLADRRQRLLQERPELRDVA
jgi:hypothetical protein